MFKKAIIPAALTALLLVACSKEAPAPAAKPAGSGAAAAPAAAASAGAAPAAGGAPVVALNFDKPEKAIEYRQGAFTLMGAHFGPIGAMVNGKIPFDAKVAADNAELVAYVSRLPWTAFGPGTDQGHETKAKPEIWTDSAKFKEGADKLQQEAPKLAAAAKTGDLEKLKVAFQATAQTCKGCHDNFRAK